MAEQGVIEVGSLGAAGGAAGVGLDGVLSPAALEREFEALVAEWRDSVHPATTLKTLLAHPAYNRTIGMGLVARAAVASLILRDLSSHPRQWFQALQAITREDPVPDGATTFEEFRRAWLEWGRSRELV